MRADQSDGRKRHWLPNHSEEEDAESTAFSESNEEERIAAVSAAILFSRYLFTIFIFIDLWWLRMITMPRGRTRLSNCTKTKIWASSSTVKAQHNHFSSTRELGS